MPVGRSSLTPRSNPFAPDETSDQIFAEHGWLQGTILSAVAYGAVVVLFPMCFYQLADKIDRSNYRLKLGLLVYVSTIFTLSTLFMGSLAQFTQLAFIDNRNYPGGPGRYEVEMFPIPVDDIGSVTFVLSNCLCDGLIIWRFIVIYRNCRFSSFVVASLPCLLYLASITMGLFWLIQISTTSPFKASGVNWTLPYFTLSLSVNIFITIAIVVRLLIHRHRITSAFGWRHGAHYTSIATMIVESATISSSFYLLFLIPYVATPTSASLSFVFLPSMGQVQIIATLLIMYRVASGNSWDTARVESVISIRQHPIRMSQAMRVKPVDGTSISLVNDAAKHNIALDVQVDNSPRRSTSQERV
ncbi:hypothetical protein HGRIS_002139 [Hohenbuehelia grisea]|uniref:Uncharacterized protein n=1 Tax=Hohenbuehelia grisea TaxID=104357 RepID=A0ABR3JKA3_9AGAR